MTKIEIIKHDIDFLKIINLAFNRKEWGKTYCLFNKQNYIINICMDSFDFRGQVGKFKIDLIYPEDEYYSSYDNYGFIDYHIINETPKFFKNYLLKRIIRLINTIIVNRTRKKAKRVYHEFNHYETDDEMIEKWDFTEAYNKIDEIDSEEIKEDILYSLNERVLELENQFYENEVDKYVEDNKECPKEMIEFVNEINDLIKLKGKNDRRDS